MRSISSKGFLRRALPFFATFAIGLLIASFFVDISRPKFGGMRGRKLREVHRLRVENEELRNENLRLKNQLENMHWDGVRMNHGHEDLPGRSLDDMVPPPPIAPAAPVAPLSPRSAR